MGFRYLLLVVRFLCRLFTQISKVIRCKVFYLNTCEFKWMKKSDYASTLLASVVSFLLFFRITWSELFWEKFCR